MLPDDPKSEWKKIGENGISLIMLKQVIGESICLYSEFVHADKDEVCAFPLMDICRVQVILQDPSDAELLAEIRSTLHKVYNLFMMVFCHSVCYLFWVFKISLNVL